ncbi:hypothetical protein C0992_003683, partial [Termitomyces sp. T32_za158]
MMLYSGRLVVRLERSTLPEHSERNFLVMRVLKILDPIKPVDPDYDGNVPVPIVGQLVMKSRRRIRLCIFDLDKFVAKAGFMNLPSVPDDEPDL